MSHEPECDYIQPLTGNKWCICEQVRAAYQRGFDKAIERHDEALGAGFETGWKHGYDEGKRDGYREGYNDHARSRAELESMFGPYVQHGKGENP